MDIIKNIIADYEKLIKTSIQIPLSNGDTIRFTFNPQDLPHLLGLQHLVDNPILCISSLTGLACCPNMTEALRRNIP